MKNENKLTWSKSDGTWGLKNYNIQNVPKKLYGPICKLHDYEKTGLSPDEVETMKEDFSPAEAAVYLRECAKKDTGWIPCSERLPECEEGAETGPVLYQSKDTGIIMAGYYGRGGKWRDSYFRTYTDPADGVDSGDIIAWRELPEPYTK